LADRGYDADYVVEKAGNSGMKVAIHPRSNRKNQREYDKDLYKQRNIIERVFNKLKHFRRFATRYDKLTIPSI
jgi:transposase